LHVSIRARPEQTAACPPSAQVYNSSLVFRVSCLVVRARVTANSAPLQTEERKQPTKHQIRNTKHETPNTRNRMTTAAGYAWLPRPQGLTDGPQMHAYFAMIADRLINQCRLVVNSQPHRFAEIEFYYHSPEHTDIFSHRDPLQETRGRWYFHKTKGVYRGGSFKGHDLTFGAPGSHGGVLIRSLEKPDGTLVDGPSLSVDHLLASTKCTAVSVLDGLIASRSVWDATNPVHLQEASPGNKKDILATSRVG